MATDPQKVERFIQLAGGAPCNLTEAARAAGISEGTGDRIMRRPEVRARVEEARQSSDEGLVEDVRRTIDELLDAHDKDGNEDWAARARGAELLMRHKEKFDEHDVAAAEEILPEGVYLVFPRVPA